VQHDQIRAGASTVHTEVVEQDFRARQADNYQFALASFRTASMLPYSELPPLMFAGFLDGSPED